MDIRIDQTVKTKRGFEARVKGIYHDKKVLIEYIKCPDFEHLVGSNDVFSNEDLEDVSCKK